jgi:multidrug efflux pump subunit AcrA (membrane-fusion protein)
VKFVLLGIALAPLVACSASPQAAARQESAPAVQTAPVESTDMPQRFEAGGIVRARATALVASRVLAPIVDVHVKPGDRVRRDQLLVTLDARDLDAANVQAAGMASAADKSAEAADADVRSAESNVTYAHATFDRIRTLHEKRSATAQELDQAASALAGAEAQRDSAQARVAAAHATRDAARAGARAASVTATYARLTAPFDGLVTERRADPGSLATPGAPLLVLEDASAFRLEAPLDEARATLIAVGQAADIRFDTAPDRVMHAQVAEIARIDPVSHAFVVKLDLRGASDLQSGLFARASFDGPMRRALTIPASALVRRGQLTFVYAIAVDGQAVLHPVSVGAASGSRVEVLAGLDERDRVVTRPGDVK